MISGSIKVSLLKHNTAGYSQGCKEAHLEVTPEDRQKPCRHDILWPTIPDMNCSDCSVTVGWLRIQQTISTGCEAEHRWCQASRCCQSAGKWSL